MKYLFIQGNWQGKLGSHLIKILVTTRVWHRWRIKVRKFAAPRSSSKIKGKMGFWKVKIKVLFGIGLENGILKMWMRIHLDGLVFNLRIHMSLQILKTDIMHFEIEKRIISFKSNPNRISISVLFSIQSIQISDVPGFHLWISHWKPFSSRLKGIIIKIRGFCGIYLLA